MTDEPDEDRLASLLAACDEALAQGRPPPWTEADVPPEIRQRVESNLPCLHLLRTLLPQTPPDDVTPLPADAAIWGLDLGRPPLWLGRFRIVREVGRGGFGVVLLADDPLLGRQVALKVPRGALMSDDLRRRFLREAKAAARLDHPHLAAVYETGVIGPIGYIVSAYCPGPNLAQWLAGQTNPPPVRTTATLVAALADGLQHAHGRGVLHRDVKPSNILLSPRPAVAADADGLPFTPRLTDFGLAKLLEEEGDQTTTGVILGTAPYMAPEQADGRWAVVGPATDVYALGAILYELLTGQAPFRGPTVLATLEQVRSGEPAPPRRFRAGIPTEPEVICLKCLRKEPGQRYASAGELAADLRRFLQGEPIHARPLGRLGKAVAWCRRPERIRDAGMFGAAVAAFDLAMQALGTSLAMAGRIPGVEPSWPALIYFLVGVCFSGLPMIAIARYTFRCNGIALWAGFLMPFLVALWLGVNAWGFLNSGGAGLIRDANVALVACSAIGSVQGAQVVFYLLALVAYYSNRHR